MKKIIEIGILLIILLTIVFYRNQIAKWVITTLFFPEGVVIGEKNEYTLDYQYELIKETDNFYAKTKQHLYNIIYTGLNNGNDSFYFFCDYDNCVNDVNDMSTHKSFLNLNTFVHPFNTYQKLYISITNYNKITITNLKTYSNEDIIKVNKQIDEIESKIITDNMTTKEKVKAFHDYIINNTKYDNNYINASTTDPTNPSHNALGPLFYNTSLCGGYTDVMAIFLNRLGLPNYRISSELHIWNLVYIDNEWLHLDLTWDDPVTTNNSDLLIDKFFLITTTKLESYDTEYHSFDKFIYSEATYN